VANTNDKPGTRLAQAIRETQRTVTVGLCPEYFPRKAPWIRLRGLWLEEAGFTPAQTVRVRVMAGCIILTID
jgi:toxic protein SymE